MPSRRRVLGTLSVAICGALAGCADPDGVLQMSEATTDAVVDEFARRIDRESDDASEVFDALLENGSTRTNASRRPLVVDRPVAADGEVYEVSLTESDGGTRTDYRIELDFDPSDTSGAEVAFEDLPAVDRERIEPSLERDPPADNDGWDIAITEHYSADELESSVLAPEPEFEIIRVDGDPVRVHTEPTETDESTFEYTLVDRLGSEEAYANALRDEYSFALTGLSDGERAVVEEAIEEGGYYAGSTDDDEFAGVARTFLDHDPVRNDEYRGHWITTYDGTAYVAMVDFLQFQELRAELPPEGGPSRD